MATILCLDDGGNDLEVRAVERGTVHLTVSGETDELLHTLVLDRQKVGQLLGALGAWSALEPDEDA